MGRANSRSNRSSGGNNRSSSSNNPLPTSEFDPAYPPNLKRSLARNDVELAALSKLHVALRSLRVAIVEEFGEESLLECVVEEVKKIPPAAAAAAAAASVVDKVNNDNGGGKNENGGEKKEKEEAEAKAETEVQTNENDESNEINDDGDSTSTPPTKESGSQDEAKEKEKRLQQLTTAFLLRMKLRRRLLNRLARRLHRVAHIMDGTSSSSSIQAPLPPLYGDLVRRYISAESEQSGMAAKMLGLGGSGSVDGAGVIKERSVKEFVEKEEMRKEVKGKLEEQRKRREVGQQEEKEKEGKEDVIINEKDDDDDGKEDKKEEPDAMEEDKENADADEVKDEGMGQEDEKDRPESMEEEDEVEETESTDVDDEDTKKTDEDEKADEDVKPDNNQQAAAPKTTNVDLLLQGDEEDGPLLDQLAEYEPGYAKLYSIGPMMPPLPPPSSTPSSTTIISPDAKVEEKADVKAEEESVVKAEEESESDVKVEEKTDVKAEDESDVEMEDGSDVEAEDKADTETEEDELSASPTSDDVEDDASDKPTSNKDVEKTSSAEDVSDEPTANKDAEETSSAEDATETPSSTAKAIPKNDSPSSSTKEEDAASKEKKVLKVTMPIARTNDDHEVNDEGEFISDPSDNNGDGSNNQSRLPFSLYSAPVRVLQPKERAAEWKRWTKEMCEKIPNQSTFDDLGVGGVGMVFDLEGRLKRKREQDEKDNALKEKEEQAPDEDDNVIRGKGGKVLRKSSPEKSNDADGDVDMDMDEADEKAKADETDNKSDKQATASDKKKDVKEKKETASKEIAPKNTTKLFSVTPVPSFHYQDLKRIRILQKEMVNYRNVQRVRERVITAQAYYDKMYKDSIDLQQAKATAMADYSKLSEEFKREAAYVKKTCLMQMKSSKSHWERRQFQLKDMQAKLGDDKALIRFVANDMIQDMKDRVTIRTAEELKGSGLGTRWLEKEADEAKSEGNENKAVAATVLGHMIDCVERRHHDALADSPTFVLPQIATEKNVISDPKTGESMAQFHARELSQLKRKIARFDKEFKEAEKKRGEAWMALSKSKGGTSQPSSSSGSANKPRPKVRRSPGNTGNFRMVPTASAIGGSTAATNRQPHPMQMQQAAARQRQQAAAQQRQQASSRPLASGAPRAPPGYAPSSYYQQQHAASIVAAQNNGPITAASIIAARNAVAAQSASATLAAVRGYTQVAPRNNVQQISQIQNIVAANLAQQQAHQRLASASGARVVIQGSSGGAQFHPVQRQTAISVNASSAPINQGQLPAVVQPPVAAALDPSQQLIPGQSTEATQKTSSLAKYGYGDKYSLTNVQARKNPDGTVVPASTPKLLPDGRYARPAGRQRKGMDWDAVKGIWFPVPEGQQGGQGDGS